MAFAQDVILTHDQLGTKSYRFAADCGCRLAIQRKELGTRKYSRARFVRQSGLTQTLPQLTVNAVFLEAPELLHDDPWSSN